LAVKSASKSSSIEYKSPYDGTAIQIRIMAGTIVQVASKKVEWVKLSIEAFDPSL